MTSITAECAENELSYTMEDLSAALNGDHSYRTHLLLLDPALDPL